MRILLPAFILLGFAACNSEKKPDESAFYNSMDTVSAQAVVSNEAIDEIIQQIPSPIEIAVLIKENGSKYNGDLLNAFNSTSKYNSNYRKALNLGVYGTDLGYTNIYEQNQAGLNYISSIKRLADELNIGQFFDIESIGRLASNSKNLDSLLLLTTQNFNHINQYLQEQNRANLSVLILIGGWLEATHIIGEISKANPSNKLLQETIGEQKIILEKVIRLLSYYKNSDHNMASLLTSFEKLQKEFDVVEITQTYQESTFEIVNGVMVVKDNSSSEIKITTEDVNNITRAISAIRNEVIG